jgi:hypothetical protein
MQVARDLFMKRLLINTGYCKSNCHPKLEEKHTSAKWTDPYWYSPLKKTTPITKTFAVLKDAKRDGMMAFDKRDSRHYNRT